MARSSALPSCFLPGSGEGEGGAGDAGGRPAAGASSDARRLSGRLARRGRRPEGRIRPHRHHHPGPARHRRFSNTSGVIDSAAGQRHGTYDGPVTLVPGLPTASDAGSRLAGNVAGVVPHDPGLQLPAFTLSAGVQLVEVPTDPNWFFLTKDASGLVDGDFGVRFTPQLELNARFQTIQDGTAPGVSVTVEVGRTYHVLVTAGPHGMSMWIDGTLIDTDPTYAGGWIANTQPIWFARGIANNFLANVVLDEIALYSRVLADAEIIALSQQTNLPVATDDHGFEVSSGATEIFDVVANDSWVGRRESLAIDIISPPAFGAVSVRSNNTIELAGYPVEQDEADSFTYRIRDAVGQSNVATVGFTVLNEALPPPLGDLTTREPLCYVESAADTVVASSAAALETAVNNAPADATSSSPREPMRVGRGRSRQVALSAIPLSCGRKMGSAASPSTMPPGP